MTDRQVGSVGLNVDLIPQSQRRLGSVGLTVEYVPSAGGGPTLLTVTATQATSIGLAGSASIARTVTLSQSVALRRGYQYIRTLSQPVSPLLILGARPILTGVTVGQLPRLQRVTTLTRAISVSAQLRLVKSFLLRRAVTQAQALTGAFSHGIQRTVTAVQAQAVSLRKSLQLARSTSAQSTHVALAGSGARLLQTAQVTAPRLVREIHLTRAITQAQSVSRSGIPVKLLLVSTVQARSLALGRAISLVRSIAQATAAYLPRGLSIERTAIQPTLLSRSQAVTLTRALAQPQLVSLQVRDVTPRLFITVSTTVGQHVSLSQATPGTSARSFAVIARGGDFVVVARAGPFRVPARGVVFTVEER